MCFRDGFLHLLEICFKPNLRFALSSYSHKMQILVISKKGLDALSTSGRFFAPPGMLELVMAGVFDSEGDFKL